MHEEYARRWQQDLATGGVMIIHLRARMSTTSKLLILLSLFRLTVYWEENAGFDTESSSDVA